MVEKKRWKVEYSHADGRKGTVEVVTIVGESGAYKYGNGKYGAIVIGDYDQGYDLRYCREKDLHKVMLNTYFGQGLVKATEI